jgi:hypothetical protein
MRLNASRLIGARIMGEVVELRMGFNVYSDELRAAIAELGFSQRKAAEMLQCQEREFRSWCAGKPCPRVVLLGLHYLVCLKRQGKELPSHI